MDNSTDQWADEMVKQALSGGSEPDSSTTAPATGQQSGDDAWAQTIIQQQLAGAGGESGPTAPATTAAGAVARAAATSIAPAYGALKGASIGGKIGSFIGGGLGLVGGGGAGALVPGADLTGAPEVAGAAAGLSRGAKIGGFVGNAIGAFIGGLLTDKAQSAALKKVAPEVHNTLQQYQSADEEQHPVAAFAGDLAGAYPFFHFAPLEAAKGAAALVRIAKGDTTWGKLTEVEQLAVKTLAINTGMGAAFAVAGPLTEGQKPTLKGITQSVAQALLMGHPRDWTGQGEVPPAAPEVKPPGTTPPPPVPPAPNALDPSEMANDFKTNPLTDAQEARIKEIVAETTKPADTTPPPPNEAPPDQPEPLPVVPPPAPTPSEAVPPATPTAESANAVDTVAGRVQPADNVPAVESPKPPEGVVFPLNLGKNPTDHFGRPITWDGKAWSLEGSKPAEAPVAEPAKSPEPVAEETKPAPAEIQPLPPATAPAGEVASNPVELPPPAPETVKAVAEAAPPVAPETPPVVKESLTPATPTPAMADWTQHQGSADNLVDLVSGAKAPVVTKGNDAAAAGNRDQQLYREFRGTEDPAAVKAEIFKGALADKSSRLSSKKRIVMQSPDGTHVTVSTPGEITRDGVKMKSIASYDPKTGKVVNRPYDELVKEGWKPLGALKTDETAKSKLETYSSQEWNGIRDQVLGVVRDRLERDASSAVGEVSEKGALEVIGEAEGQRGSITSTPNAKTFQAKPMPRTIRLERPLVENLVKSIGEPKWESVEQAHDHITAAIDRMDPDKVVRLLNAVSPKDLNSGDVDFDAGFKLLEAKLFEIYDTGTTKISPDEAITALEAFSTKPGLAGSEGAEAGTPPEAGTGSAESEPASGTAGGEPVPSAAPAGTEADAAGSAAGEPKPDAVLRPATPEPAADVKSPKVKAADLKGLTAADLKSLKAIAMRIAESRDMEDSEAKNIILDGHAVKVDGKAALLYENEIHMADGTTMEPPISLALEIGKFRKTEAIETIKRLRPTDARTAQISASVERTMRAYGIRVDRAVDVLVDHFGGVKGQYKEILNGKGNVKRIITWMVADVNNPSSDSLVSLLHEVGHAVFARETPERQAALHEALQEASTTALQSEESLVEGAAQNLVDKGFNPAEAKGLMSQIWMAVKDMYHGTLMAVAKMAGYPVDQARARAYFENRVKMAVTREPMSWVNFLGGPRMKLPDWDSVTSERSVTPTITRNRSFDQTTNPRAYLSTKEGAPVGIAAINHFAELAQGLVDEWKTTSNIAGLSDADIAKRFIKLPAEVGGGETFTNGETPASLVDAAAKLHGVDPTTKIADLPNDVLQKRAAALAHRMLDAMRAETNKTTNEAHAQVKSDANTLEANNSRLVKLTKNYVDLDMMNRESREECLNLVDEARDTVRGIRDTATKAGQLEQAMKELGEKTENGDLSQPALKAIDGLRTLLTRPESVEGRRFSDTLKHFGEMDINWKMPAKDISDILRKEFADPTSKYHNDPLLADFFTQPATQSRALFALAISFAKSQSHFMDLYAQRAAKIGVKSADANKLLQEMLNVSRNSLSALKSKIEATFGADRALRDRMIRLADKIGDLRDRNHDLVDSIARGKQTVDFWNKVFKPAVDVSMADLERQVGITLRNFEVAHEAKVPVPDADGQGITDKILKLRTDVGKRGDRQTLSSEVKGWMRRMREYVANPANQAAGAKYNEVADALAKLDNHEFTNEHLNLQQNFIEKLLAPIQDRCNVAGTTIARLCGQAFNKYSSSLRAKVKEVVQQGTNFSTLKYRAAKAFGYPALQGDSFWNNIVAPALHDMEQNQMRWATLPKRQDRIMAAVNHMVDFTGAKPSARDAMARLFIQHIQNCDLTVKNGADLGNKVLDKDDRYQIYRPVLGEAPFTLPRRLTDAAADFFKDHLAMNWGKPLDLKVAARLYDTDPNLLRQSLVSRFSPEVWDRFMGPIARNDRSQFYAPEVNGLHPMASRENVLRAYEGASDPVTFAENLARLYGAKPDAAFVTDTLDTIQNFHNLLRTMVGDEAQATQGGTPAPRRFIADARHVEAAPKEWLEYLQSDQYTMEKIIHGQAFQAAYGRNGVAMDANLVTAINEQTDLYQKYNAMRQAIDKENPGMSERGIQAAIKARAEMDGFNYSHLKNAKSNLDSLNGVKQNFEALKSMTNSGKIPELLPWARLMQTIGGWTVSGAGTAITAHSVFLEQPTRLLGLSGRSLKMTGDVAANTGKVMANSIIQAFGGQCRFEATRMLSAFRAGIFDPINTNLERLTTAYMHSQTAYRESGKVGQTVGKVADVGGALLNTDLWAPGARDKALARQQAGQAIAPTFKLFSPFHWIAECIQYSNFITWQKHMEGMVTAGASHFAEHPENLADDAFRFKREQLQNFPAGDREFKFLTQQMANYGFSLEGLAREAHRNSGTDKPILSDEVNKAVQQLTLNEITLESSLTSRMPFLQGLSTGTGGLGIAMNPFLGWPLQKTYQVMHAMREPSGEGKLADARTLRAGLTPYLAILPIGMAVAWLRNKFDEDALGRKQNVSDLGNIHDAKSAILTALDNASRIGTFGVLGELANNTFNNDNVRPLSLDSRVFFINTLENTYNAGHALLMQTYPQVARGDFAGAEKSATDYQTVVRPLFQTLGGNGLLQNLGILNHALSLDDAESRVANRISVNNYLRVAGREQNLDVRSFGGMLQNASAPNPIKPFIGQMILAAYANDHNDFKAAKNEAIAQARQEEILDKETGRSRPMNQEEAMKKVVTAYEAQNPLRIVFKTPPTEAEFRTLVASLPPNGKASVNEAIQLYAHYAEQIGANASVFGRERGDGRQSTVGLVSPSFGRTSLTPGRANGTYGGL